MPFKNVIYDYPLGKAMADGFVKEPAVATRKNFNPAGMSPEEIERLKLEDGIRLHENVKVELETYARESGNADRQAVHAGHRPRHDPRRRSCCSSIQSDGFFEGRYKDKVIQVDSSKTGAEEEEMIERLLTVEHTDEPTEIVIHVNMLKEGWDVTNLYTIVPLRAANARILIEQSIGRGLRLPYGKRTGVAAVDRLNIVAHDKFQEIIDEANRPDSAIRLQAVVLDSDATRAEDGDGGVAVATWRPSWAFSRRNVTSSTTVAGKDEAPGLHQAGGAEGGADRLRGDPQAGEPAANAAELAPSARSRRSRPPSSRRSKQQHQPAQLELDGIDGKSRTSPLWWPRRWNWSRSRPSTFRAFWSFRKAR